MTNIQITLVENLSLLTDISVASSEMYNDKNVQVFVAWDFEDNTGYDVYETYIDYTKINNFEESKYRDHFELIAHKVKSLETAEMIGQIYAYSNKLKYGGNCS